MKNSLFERIPADIQDEVFEPLIRKNGVIIERIISKAHASPEGFWYDQEKNEFVLLVQGSAGIRFRDPDTFVLLRPGDYLNIPAHASHRVDWTDPEQETIWLAVHY